MGASWGKFIIPVSILIAASIIGGAIYLSRSSQTTLEPAVSQVSLEPTVALDKEQSTFTLIPTAQVEPTDDDTLAIRAAVVKKLGTDEASLDVTVSQNTGKHAKGGVKEKGTEVGGGYFLAAEDEGEWKIVYDGQAQPSCDDIEAYSFPKSMVPECLSTNGEVIAR